MLEEPTRRLLRLLLEERPYAALGMSPGEKGEGITGCLGVASVPARLISSPQGLLGVGVRGVGCPPPFFN